MYIYIYIPIFWQFPFHATRPHPSWHWHASLHCGSTLILPIPFPFDFPPWSQLDEPVHFLTMDWKFRRLLSPLHPQAAARRQEKLAGHMLPSATPSQVARFLSLLCLDCILAAQCNVLRICGYAESSLMSDDHHDATQARPCGCAAGSTEQGPQFQGVPNSQATAH